MITKLSNQFPKITFVEGKDFVWSPDEMCIYYNKTRLNSLEGQQSLFHEVGHGVLEHETYTHDIDLLKYELDAWEEAKSIAKDYPVAIEQDYVEDCLDSYRDWLKKRSTCPDCSYVNFQTTHSSYDCFNCGCSWQVPVSQICRIQRRKVKV